MKNYILKNEIKFWVGLTFFIFWLILFVIMLSPVILYEKITGKWEKDKAEANGKTGWGSAW